MLICMIINYHVECFENDFRVSFKGFVYLSSNFINVWKNLEGFTFAAIACNVK